MLYTEEQINQLIESIRGSADSPEAQDRCIDDLLEQISATVSLGDNLEDIPQRPEVIPNEPLSEEDQIIIDAMLAEDRACEPTAADRTLINTLRADEEISFLPDAPLSEEDQRAIDRALEQVWQERHGLFDNSGSVNLPSNGRSLG